jgi:hypothetical protein
VRLSFIYYRNKIVNCLKEPEPIVVKMTATETVGVGSRPLVVLLSVAEPIVVAATEHFGVGS